MPDVPRPVLSYATEAEARAYVARVLGRLAARERAGRARVYLICPPSMTGKGGALPKLRPVLAALLPGAELLTYGDVFDQAERPRQLAADRAGRIAEAASGAVVLPRAWHDGEAGRRYLLGDAARIEAEALAALGVPVLVLGGSGLVAWPDARVTPAAGPHPFRLPWAAELPELPPGAPLLPTVAASYRAMGIAPPARRPASSGAASGR